MKTLGQETIVLVGMMGTGKSSLGKRLAQDLQMPFYDSDAEIERAADMSIADIFAQHGETDFRAGERRVIARLLDGAAHIMASGGGAFCDKKTRQLISKKSLSIWLDMPIEALVERVKKQSQKRPLLQAPAAKAENIHQRMGDLLETRRPLYAKADIHLPLQKQSFKKSALQLLQVVQDYYNE